jgi:hypothetical protein
VIAEEMSHESQVKKDSRLKEHRIQAYRGQGAWPVPGTAWRAECLEHMMVGGLVKERGTERAGPTGWGHHEEFNSFYE